MAQDWKSADLELCLERAEPVEGMRKMGTSRPSTGWKICLSLLAIGLCAAAAICFTDQKRDITEGSENLRRPLRQISDTQTAIHLEGLFNHTFSKTTVEWRDHQDQSFHKGALKLVKNEIVIPKKGIYFVYSQVSFRINCQVSPDQAQPLETVQLSHMVMRASRAFDDHQPLLNTKRSGCKQFISEEDSGKRWYSAINLGAVFSLEEGDRLSTRTEPHAELPSVEGDSGKSFFGVFAL
ncbi:tumor necrosis factor-like [Clupea harengus]|uniref:Tumor necrosis factor-like n=1 Tax=Clupea harengus TaxID=7950 RepID=A0A8M1KYJ6_CLUHA|nr:tumor necrosis factor-like [Clupea harengus]